MKKTLLLTLFIANTLMTSTLFADTLNIGVVDFQRMMQNSTKLAQKSQQLKKQFEPQHKLILQKRKAIEALIAKGKRDEAIMRDEDKHTLAADLTTRAKEINTLEEKFKKQLDSEQHKAIQSIIEQMTEVISKIAKTNKLDLVIPKESVLYANDRLNITGQVENALHDKK